MNISITTAKKDQIQTIITLLNALYLELGEERSSCTFLNDEFINEIINSGKTSIYLALADNEIAVGIATLTESQAIYAGGNYGTLDEMYILPEYRWAGIGKQLIKKVIETGKEKNWKRIDVTTPTEENRENTISFYKSCGFTFTGNKLKLNIKD